MVEKPEGFKLRESDHTENIGVDGRIILKWILKKWDRGLWTGLIWLRIGRGDEAVLNGVINFRFL
jgi:hypothetical protein